MKVGDLVKDKDYHEVGLILEIDDESDVVTYRVIHGTHITWFAREYIENDCELVNECRQLNRD